MQNRLIGTSVLALTQLAQMSDFIAPSLISQAMAETAPANSLPLPMPTSTATTATTVATAAPPSGASSAEAAGMNIGFLVLLVLIMYFLVIRPQQKQVKAHGEMISHLQRGDSIETQGGILGRIHRIDDDVLMVEVGEVEVTPRTFKPVRVKVRKSTIRAVVAKTSTTPPPEDTSSDNASK